MGRDRIFLFHFFCLSWGLTRTFSTARKLWTLGLTPSIVGVSATKAAEISAMPQQMPQQQTNSF
jgi:hypothetical protein